METFGYNLRVIRKSKGMNQNALGSAVGVGQTTIANYEKGLRFPTGELLKKIAEVLNVSIDELMDHRVIKSHGERKDPGAYRDLFTECLIDGREQEAIALIWEMAPTSQNILDIYNDVLKASMISIGNLWEAGGISVAQEHYASQVVNKIMSVLSTIPGENIKGERKAICMSLSQEAHTIGIRMVSEFMNMKGIQAFFIGSAVPIGGLIEMIKREKADILVLSVTMSYHQRDLIALIEGIRAGSVGNKLKIIFGGQAFDPDTKVSDIPGADAYLDSFYDIEKWLIEEEMIHS